MNLIKVLNINFKLPITLHALVKAPLNEKISVEQTLIIKRSGNDWVASMEMSDFPEQKTPNDAANKLGDWMVALGSAIKEGDFNLFDLRECK